ncbi:MAG: winged helix DNA-binding domain-containing protein [Chloroflexota bacterium]|nr:winged helix DNA-binding domain-containing protein [Chloroflexota bacterium]
MPGRSSASGPVLSQRALNRAFLARQLLLDRAPLAALDAIHQLAGLQSQAPRAPFVALWTRLIEFDPDELSQLMLARAVVRIAVMRSTIYLVTAADCLAFRPLLQPVLERGLHATYRKQLAGVDLDQVVAAGRSYLSERPRTFDQLGKHLNERWPERDGYALSQVVRALVPLVQVPPRGVWGGSGPAAHTPADLWLQGVHGPEPAIDDLVIRYLAAYGPATARDVQTWSGLTRLGPVLARLRPRLVTFRAEDGRELFDLAEAPRPDPETPAPLRFLAEFDTALLSHQDRTRIISDAQRRVVFTINGIVRGTILVDGVVAGVWKLVRSRTGAALEVESFAPLPAAMRSGLADEGERLLRFAASDAPTHEIRFATLA